MKEYTLDNNSLLEFLNSNEYVEQDDIEDTGLQRARNYFILLYEDTKSYDFQNALRILKSYKDYAYIKHIPEKDEKKEHIHFFLHLDNAISIKTLSNKTGIPDRFFQVPRSIRSVNRYLIHLDDEDKIQYNIENVIVSKNWERRFKKCFDDIETEEEIILKIYNFIDSIAIDHNSLNYAIALKTIMLWSYQNVYDSVYRKYRIEFDNYLRNKI